MNKLYRKIVILSGQKIKINEKGGGGQI